MQPVRSLQLITLASAGKRFACWMQPCATCWTKKDCNGLSWKVEDVTEAETGDKLPPRFYLLCLELTTIEY